MNLGGLMNHSTEKVDYRIAAGGATSLSYNDDFTLVEPGGIRTDCTFLGSATLSFDPVSGSAGGIDLSFQAAPVTGWLIRSAGIIYLVTDDQFDINHITATVTLTGGVPPEAIGLSATGPLSGLADGLADQVEGLGNPSLTPTATNLRGLDTPVALEANGAVVSMIHDQTAIRPISPDEVMCFAAGTLIRTDRGPVAVEQLVAGDLIWTKDHGFQPLRWIGSVTLSAALLERCPNLRPIRIRAGALGGERPERDLVVSPQHRILVRSATAVHMFGAMEVLIPAKQLLQIEGIDYVDDGAGVEYFHLLFDRHQILMSNGAETESLFTGPQALRALSPAARAEVFSLFPELHNGGYQPEAIRPLPSGRQSRKLAQRHASKHLALTN